jgi:MinD-like ATPase involved in chromosome partitioning or flagellar assembly
MATETVAFVGAAGGTGTTRLTVECGATLARAGWEIAVFDAAYATQGLATYLDGRIDQDVTALATGEAGLEETLYEYPAEIPGRLVFCPARAPFERLARAKTADAAERFERQIAAASLSHDAVLVDTPPVGANQALASVNAADRVAVVTTDTERGADALALAQDRLADIGTPPQTVVANRSGGDGPLAPDARIPPTDARRPGDCPTCLRPEGTFSPAVAAMAEDLFECSLGLEFSDEGRFSSLVGST